MARTALGGGTMSQFGQFAPHLSQSLDKTALLAHLPLYQYQGNPMAIDNPAAATNSWPRPRVLDVLALIWHYYQQEGHQDGGSLHEVLMAHHLEPEVLAACREQAISAADELAVQILDLMAVMPEPARHRVVDYASAIDRDDPGHRPHRTLTARPKPVEVGSTDRLPLDAELF